MFMCVVNPSIDAIMFICWCVKSVWLNDSPLKRKFHFDEIFVIFCTESYQNDDFPVLQSSGITMITGTCNAFTMFIPVQYPEYGLCTCGYERPIFRHLSYPSTLHWRHNEGDGVPNHMCLGWLLNRLFRRRTKEHQISVSLAFVRGWPVVPLTKGQ